MTLIPPTSTGAPVHDSLWRSPDVIGLSLQTVTARRSQDTRYPPLGAVSAVGAVVAERAPNGLFCVRWYSAPGPPLAGRLLSSEAAAAAAALRDAMVIVGGTWAATGVNALLAGLIGVAATLLGSFTTYLFQSRTAGRAQSFEREERLRYEQVNACSAFASAMTELKRGLITLWFHHRRDAAGTDYLAARIEC